MPPAAEYGSRPVRKYATLEDTVGNTPLVRLQRIGARSLAQHGNVVLCKLEGAPPGRCAASSQPLAAAAFALFALSLALNARAAGNNPAGSVKDRPALYMIQEAEREGRIKPGQTLIEATSGEGAPRALRGRSAGAPRPLPVRSRALPLRQHGHRSGYGRGYQRLSHEADYACQHE